MSKRTNLVTGACGFTGMYVVKELLDNDEDVVATDLGEALDDPDNRRKARSIGLDFDDPNLELVAANLLEPATLDDLFDGWDIDRVFHIASLYDYSASLDKLRAINVDGTRNLLEVAVDADLDRFVHWSTCGVFGKPYTAADGDKVNVPFNEESSSPKTTAPNAEGPVGTHLVNDYSVSKWEQEKLVWDRHRNDDLPLTVVRPAPIYGPGSSYGHGGIILTIAAGLVPAIPADARNYITTSVHVADVAGFAVHIADKQEGLGEDYNIVDDSVISYYEFLNYIALLCGRELGEVPGLKMKQLKPIMVHAAMLWRWLEKKFGIPRVRVFEIQSAHYMSSSYWISNRKSLETGYEYRFPEVKEGLKDTIAWFRDMGWLTDSSRMLSVNPEGSK
jgi:nucleoside-diphosphate-sugar epimerase